MMLAMALQDAAGMVSFKRSTKFSQALCAKASDWNHRPFLVEGYAGWHALGDGLCVCMFLPRL